MKTIKEFIAHNIIERREALGLKQKELAKKANINAIGLNRIEKGVRRAGPNVLASLAVALGCTPEDLYLEPKKEGLKLGEAAQLLQAYENATHSLRKSIRIQLGLEKSKPEVPSQASLEDRGLTLGSKKGAR